MFKFIKENKVFVFFLSIVIGFIGFIGINALNKDENDNPPIFVESPEEPDDLPIDETKELVIDSFTGVFTDVKNVIQFKWNITENDARIKKVELYKGNRLMQEVTGLVHVDCSIEEDSITTGSNEFTLKVITDKEAVIEKTVTVNVDYVFDVVKTSQFVDNNLGKGVLLSITYRYHRQTPVGIPNMQMTTSLNGYYEHRYLEQNTTHLSNGYEKTTAYYFMSFDQTDQTNVTWNIEYNFISVGEKEYDVIVKDMSNIVYDTNDILLPSMESDGE